MMAVPERYTRQAILPQIGDAGQRELAQARAVVIGAGAIGCMSSILLARAGIGHLKIVDRDVVELVNLQRQILFDEQDVDEPKALVAERKLKAMNSDIEVEGIAKDVNFSNVLEIIEGVHVVLDGTDNLDTRYLLNDACIKLHLPFIYGGAISTHGMVMAIIPGVTACFRCLLPQMPPAGSLPTCETAGILNTVPTTVASIQVTQAIKLLLGQGLNGDLIVYDAWSNEMQRLAVKRREECESCVKGNLEFLEARKRDVVTSLCGRNAVSIDPLKKGEISLQELAERLKKLGDVKGGASTLVFNTGSYSLTIFRDGRALIKGTNNEGIARSLYARYIGH